MKGSSSTRFMASLLILLAISSEINSSLAAASKRLSREFIRTSCRSTLYPSLCFSSLKTHANSIQTSPRLLARTALNVSLSSAKLTSNMMVKISKKRHGMSPPVVAATKDCLEVLSDSVDELRDSIGEMRKLNSSNFQLIIGDIQTWVSAALTDETTCTDGLEGYSLEGKLKTIVRGRIVRVAKLTSNALALINRFASLHG